MFQKIVKKFIARRHFWRDVGFDELSELYVSVMFRGLAISLTGLFVPVYMLRLGYDPSSIMQVVAWYFTGRVLLFDFLSGYCVAKFGPKHTMLVGNILLVASTAMFLTINICHWPIYLIGLIWGSSASFFFIPFNVDFSKVKHSSHSGKELGYIYVMEKVGSAAGPIIGGIIATFIGPEYIFAIATVLLLFGLVPLFRTSEPVKLNQHISFKGLPFDKRKRDYISAAAIGVENTLCIFIWPLFIGMFVLLDKTAYVKLGFMSSASLTVAVLTAYAIGKIVDDKKGRALLRANAVTNSLLHLIRPFVSVFPSAFLVGVTNEVVTTGYRMPYYKGLFDAADELPGYRIAYLTSIEFFSSIFKCLVWWFLVLLTQIFSTRTVINIGFIIAAIASQLIMTERFQALAPRRNHVR